jgi:hypothetical protein
MCVMGMAGCSHKLAAPVHAEQSGSEQQKVSTADSVRAASQPSQQAFTVIPAPHSVFIVGRGIKLNIDYGDNDPEAVNLFAGKIADYLNSLGDNPEFSEAK